MTEPLRYAARCRFLRMTLDSKKVGGVVNLCQHIVRDGADCVGPFLDDTETACGLWELKPGDYGVAVPGFDGPERLRELPRRGARGQRHEA